MDRFFKVRVIIPTLNEVKNVGRVISQLGLHGYDDVLVVDGNSRDKTAEFAKMLGAKVISQKGKGKGTALRQGFEESRSDFDAVVILDADGSMSPQEISRFVEAIKNGAEIAKGSRFLYLGGSKDFTLTRHLGNRLLTIAFNFLFLTEYTDLCYGYMAFSKDALNKLIPSLTSDGFEIETEICAKATIMGLKVQEVPSFEHLRYSGSSNLNAFKDGYRIMKVILKVFFRRFQAE